MFALSENIVNYLTDSLNVKSKVKKIQRDGQTSNLKENLKSSMYC